MAMNKDMMHSQTNSLFEKAGEVLDGVVKLKERIAELEKENTELRSKNEGLLYALADAETDLAMATRWRKVSEELPKVNQYVLVADAFGLEDSITMAQYTNEGWELNNGSLIKKGWFKFWCELPKVPEVK